MKQRNLRLIIIAVVVLGVSLSLGNFFGASAKSDSTVGTFDMTRIQNELPDFQKLQSFFKDKDSEFNYFRGYLYQQQQNIYKELDKKYSDLKKGKTTAEQDNLTKQMQDEFKQKTDELNSQLQKKQQEIETAKNDQYKATLEKLRVLIAKVAKDKKLSLVLEKNSVFYGENDITQAIIDLAVKEAGNGGKKTGK